MIDHAPDKPLNFRRRNLAGGQVLKLLAQTRVLQCVMPVRFVLQVELRYEAVKRHRKSEAPAKCIGRGLRLRTNPIAYSNAP